MTREKFEGWVVEALDGLPEVFRTQLDNVEIVVEVWPTREQRMAGGVGPGQTLFGLYQGIPKTKRSNYTAVLPDKITIFAGPILTSVGFRPDSVREQVQKTVIHEIAHHFGMTDQQIRKTGY